VRLLHELAKIHARFDDRHLVSHAGLIPGDGPGPAGWPGRAGRGACLGQPAVRGECPGQGGLPGGFRLRDAVGRSTVAAVLLAEPTAMNLRHAQTTSHVRRGAILMAALLAAAGMSAAPAWPPPSGPPHLPPRPASPPPCTRPVSRPSARTFTCSPRTCRRARSRPPWTRSRTSRSPTSSAAVPVSYCTETVSAATQPGCPCSPTSACMWR
jgi:hypothetical protein